MSTTTTEDDLIITCQFDAVPSDVFAAWADPDQMARWMGPEGFTAPVIRSDFRVGGLYEICIRSPEGQDYWWGGSYVEIDAPRRIGFSVVTYGWPGETTLVRAPETRISIVFEPAKGGGTTMTFRQSPVPPLVDRTNHEEGWRQAFDKLQRYLC